MAKLRLELATMDLQSDVQLTALWSPAVFEIYQDNEGVIMEGCAIKYHSVLS